MTTTNNKTARPANLSHFFKNSTHLGGEKRVRGKAAKIVKPGQK